MYQAYLLLKTQNDFTLAKARQQLAEAFPDATFTEGSGSLAMETPDWELSVQTNDGPEVLAESRQIAEQITGVDDDQGIATCARRVEIASDVPDPRLFSNAIGSQHPGSAPTADAIRSNEPAR